jgi:preprotein translocase subunit SecG
VFPPPPPATTTGRTAVAASDHFLLYYAGVLALIALTAEVGIGLVASDRIFMKPSARVTAQALHRAMGFGAIAFLAIHIVLEIIAGRSQPADAVIPFLDKGKTFYLGLGTVASDMFIVIIMTGIYRARLAASMSPKAWRVIHASAYAAWIFGLVHGLLAGRPAKSFFGFSGFVAWSYGVCVVAVAAALMVRLVAKNRAGNELASHPVPDSGGTGGWTAAAAALSGASALPGAAALTATAMPAPALAAGSPAALDGARARSRQPGRAPLALPAGASGAQPRGRQMRSAPYDGRAAYLADTRRIGATGPIGATGSFDRTGQFGGPGQAPRERTGQFGQSGHGHTGPVQRVGPYEQTGTMPQVGRYEGAGSQYERTGQIDRPGPYAQPPQEQPHGGQVPGYRPAGSQAAYGSPSGSVQPAPPWPGPAQYGQPGSPMMPRQHDQTGPYERPHDDWSGPMQRIGPTAAAPRYAAGNYNDWSGPLERIDPAAPPSQYGLPSPYAADGQHGGNDQYERPRAEPRYERTGEIDRSGRNPSGQYSQAQYSQAQYGAPAGQSSYGSASPQYHPPGYAPPAYGQEGQPGQPMSRQHDQSGAYERPHQAQYPQAQYPQAQYQPGQYQQAQYQQAQSQQAGYQPAGAYEPGGQPGQYQPGQYQPGQYQPGQYQPGQSQQAGYQPAGAYEPGGQPGQYQAPGHYEERMQYDSYDQYPPGQYGRPGSDPRERAEHYASFADQDATYTRPRPPGARDQFSPQDETDPLNIVPLNIGNYS